MNPTINFKFDRPLHNEDAPAVANDRFLIVCDGLGAGGQNKHTINGETHTSAYYGSRLLSEICEKFYEENYETIVNNFNNIETLNTIVDELKTTIKTHLDEYVDEHKLKKTIKGKSIKILPSTLSSLIYNITDDGVEVVVISAGDTRAFSLTPQKGLQQLSKDDVDDDVDAFEKATIVNNNICQDREFHLNFRCFKLECPCILFVCSDGCYDYFSSPMEVEYILDASINAWFSVENVENGVFGEKLGDFIANRSKLQDDCSMAAVILKCNDENQFRSDLKERARTIEEKYIKPYDLLDKEAKKNDGKYNDELTSLKQEIINLDKKINVDIANRIRRLIINYLCDSPIDDTEKEVLDFIIEDASFSSFLESLNVKEKELIEENKNLQEEKNNVYNELRTLFTRIFTETNNNRNIYLNRSRTNIFYNPASDLYNEEQKYQKIYDKYLRTFTDFETELNYIKSLTPQQIYENRTTFELSRKYQAFWSELISLMGCETRIRSLKSQVDVEVVILDDRRIEEAFTKAWKSEFLDYRRLSQYQEVCRLYDKCKCLLSTINSFVPFSNNDKTELFEGYYKDNAFELNNRVIEHFGNRYLSDAINYDNLIDLKKKYDDLENEALKYIRKKYALWTDYKVDYELFKHAMCEGVV